MNSIFIAPGIMTGIGLFFGIILVIADRFLKVQVDPRIEKTERLLPGSNCGACGQPGCRALAEQIVLGTKPPGSCTVATMDAIVAIAELLQVNPGKREKTVARLHCAGGHGQAYQIAEYHGLSSCLSASVLASGGKGCTWGCLGLGDCQRACTFDAINMNANGLPAVDIERCTACGDCVDTCPRDLFDLMPISHKLIVQCRIPLAGELARALCKTACDACGRCASDAAPGLIKMQDNLPVINYAAGILLEPKATFRCPTGAIVWVDGKQSA
jgi:Na+-translocating ferredoxin:NAD+ oxidoreductase RNF subunit RnfB